MQVFTPFPRMLFSFVAILGWQAAAPAAAAPEFPRLASADARELWRKGSDQVLAGDFSSATGTLERVQRLEPNNSGVQRVLGWMREAQSLEESRERYRARIYQYYVDKALKAAKEAREGAPVEKSEPPRDAEAPEPKTSEDADGEGDPEGDDADEDDDTRYKWSRALLYAHNAMVNTKDEDAFRAEPWLAEIVENAEVEIDRHRTANEWRDALALYDLLHRLFPDREGYEEGYDFCRKRAHLDFVYGKRDTWRTDLADVTPAAVRETLDRISDDYVEAPDSRDLAHSALEHLLLLAQADTLTEAFPTLGEADLVARFLNRINGLIRKRIEGGRKFRVRHVRSLFNQVLSVNRDTLRLPEELIVDEFVAGLLEPLDDFTSVVWPAEVSEFNKQTRGEFVGVGIQITQDPGKAVRVESPLEDSPAYNAGIKPGDLITEVDGKSTLEMTITAAVRTITGEPGTRVVLTIQDPITKESRQVPLKRTRIKIRTVRGNLRDESRPTGWDYFVDEDLKIGYVRVSGFMDRTVDDLDAVLQQLESEGCRGLILDLRFNPGGLLTSAVNMCELFLDADAPIVQTKGRNRHQNMTIRARGKERGYKDLPLIVMVNEYSASASEIVAGALAGLKESCVVGTRTFGKGSVQNLIPIMDNQGYLKLTTAHYYVWDSDLPKDDPWYLLHRKKDAKTWGIEPHVQVKVIPQENGKILRLRRQRDVLRGKDQDEVPKEILERRATVQRDEEFPEDEDPDVDPQLVIAVDLMRIKLLSEQPWALAPRPDRALTAAKMPEETNTPKGH